MEDALEEGGGVAGGAEGVLVREADAESFFSAGDGDIEFASVLGALLEGFVDDVVGEGRGVAEGVGDGKEGVGLVVDAEDDDIVEFETFALVDGHDVDAVGEQFGRVDEVAFVEGGHEVVGMVADLFEESGVESGVPFLPDIADEEVEFGAEVVEDVLLLPLGIDGAEDVGEWMGGGGLVEKGLEELELGNEGGEGGGDSLYLRVVEEFLLREEGAVDFRDAIVYQRESCADVFVGEMGVLSLEMEGLEERRELVLAESGLDESDDVEGVENLEGDIFAEGAQDVGTEYLIVEADVVSEERAMADIVEELLESLLARCVCGLSVESGQGVGDGAEEGGYLSGSVEDEVEVGAGYPFSLTDLEGGNLNNVVVEGVEASGLGVEKDYFLTGEDVEEVGEVGAGTEEVGGGHEETTHDGHEVAGPGGGGDGVDAEEESSPGHGVEVVGEEAEEGGEGLEVSGSEHVGAGDFEMRDALEGESAADLVGGGVGGDEDGEPFGGGEGEVVLSHGCGAEAFVLVGGVASEDEVERLLREVDGGPGEQVGADVEFVMGVGVEEVEEVFWRTVVLVEVYDVAVAFVFEQFELAYLSTQEGEDGLLLVAEIHDGGGGRGVDEQVDDGRLEGVEVLDFVDLNPGIAFVLAVGIEEEGVESEDQDVGEANEMILLFVLSVFEGVDGRLVVGRDVVGVEIGLKDDLVKFVQVGRGVEDGVGMV